jgi:hypothetical protein
VAPAAANGFTEALLGGKIDLDIRYRYEFVKTEGTAFNANASTIRLRLGYATAEYEGFWAYLGFASNRPIGSERYNSLRNGLTQYRVVADPKETVVDQMYLGWAGLEKTKFIVGRKAINLDNQRFVGAVAWRQTQQTFDSFVAQSDYVKKTNLFYAYLNNQNTVINTNVGHKSHLLNGAYNFSPGKLSGYAYLLEFKDTNQASHKNFGVRFDGSLELSETIDLLYTGEYANQSPYKGGNSALDNDYIFLTAGAKFETGKIQARVAYEVLGGNGDAGFATPLATLHKFNGWADRFLATPADGLRDAYVQASGTIAGIKLIGVYHDFRRDVGGGKYGSEFDFYAGKWFKKRYLVALKYARYMTSADSDASFGPPLHTRDNEKIWAMLQFKL